MRGKELEQFGELSFLDQATILQRRLQAKTTMKKGGKPAMVKSGSSLETFSRGRGSSLEKKASGDDDDIDPLLEAVAKRLKCERYALSHSMLASLPCSEIITTNYDQLVEKAAESHCKFRAKREITLIARGMKLTRLCSHAPVSALLPARFGQTGLGKYQFSPTSRGCERLGGYSRCVVVLTLPTPQS